MAVLFAGSRVFRAGIPLWVRTIFRARFCRTRIRKRSSSVSLRRICRAGRWRRRFPPPLSVLMHGPESRGEMPQKLGLRYDFKSSDALTPVVYLENRFYQIVDVALRVDAPRERQA